MIYASKITLEPGHRTIDRKNEKIYKLPAAYYPPFNWHLNTLRNQPLILSVQRLPDCYPPSTGDAIS
jgi:hypothetical protein